MSEGRPVSQLLACGMDNQGIVVWFSASQREFFLLQNLKTGSEAHPTAYLMSNGTYPISRVARAWRWALVSSGKVKNTWH